MNVVLIKVLEILKVLVAISVISFLMALMTYENSALRNIFEREKVDEPEYPIALKDSIDFNCSDNTGIVHPDCVKSKFVSESTYLGVDDLPIWINKVIPEYFTFEIGTYYEITTEAKKIFHDYAYNQYLEFLKENRIPEMAQSNSVDISTFVSSSPYLITKKTTGGRYIWIYEVPVLMSFKSPLYQQNGNEQIRNMLFRLQIAKDEQAELGGVLIEIFTVKNNI